MNGQNNPNFNNNVNPFNNVNTNSNGFNVPKNSDATLGNTVNPFNNVKATNEFNLPQNPNVGINTTGEINQTPVVEKTSVDITCPHCGFKANPNNKMCLHCGKLLGATNQVNEVTTNGINQGGIIYDAPANVTQKPIYITNIVLGIIGIIAIFLCSSLLPVGAATLLMVSIPSLLVGIFYSMCIQILLFKANLPWWGYFVPIYNVFLISKLMTKRYTFILYSLVPSITILILNTFLAKIILLFFVGISGIYMLVLSIVMLSSLARRFGRSRLGMVLLPFIFIPWTALSSYYECD